MMKRRNSVRLQDIVASDCKASSHYKKLQQSHSGLPGLSSMNESGGFGPQMPVQEVVTITLPDGKPLEISCDPLLIAEFLHMKESGNSDYLDKEDEGKDEEDEGDTFDTRQLAMGASVSHRPSAAVGASGASADPTSSSAAPVPNPSPAAVLLARKRSAIDEHKRVTAALRAAGVMLDDVNW